jgi:hypothetical protein
MSLETQRMFYQVEHTSQGSDSLAGGQAFELAVHLTEVKRDCDRAAQRNPAQHPRSRLR